MLSVIVGPMFCGKTEALLRRARRAQIAKCSVEAFLPEIDARSKLICSHDGAILAARRIDAGRDVGRSRADVVLVDEAQFFDSSIVDGVIEVVERGGDVVVAGLDLDYLQRPFGSMGALLCVAQSVEKLTAVCELCGRPASLTKRLGPTSPESALILVGGKERYSARCRDCYADVDPAAQSR